MGPAKWNVLKEYLPKELPPVGGELHENARYRRAKCLKTQLSTKVRMYFLLSMIKMFEILFEYLLIHVFMKYEMVQDHCMNLDYLRFCLWKERDADFEISPDARKLLNKLNLKINKTPLHDI